MVIKILAVAGGLALISGGVAMAGGAADKPAGPYAAKKPVKPAPEKLSPQAQKAAAASAAEGNYVIVDGQVRIPVNVDVAAQVGIPIEVVASAPVPDTPDNRARYGGPMSNGGARTKPAGN